MNKGGSMKKGFLLCMLLGLMMFAMGNTVDLFEPRIAGTAGSFIQVEIDTADTNASGILLLNDTIFSDTVSLADSNYKFVTIYGKLVSMDTGLFLDDDSTLDNFVMQLVTTVKKGTANWTVLYDTVVDVGDSFRHNFVMDSMIYDELFWRTIYIDTLNPSDFDTNTYYFDLEIFGRPNCECP